MYCSFESAEQLARDAAALATDDNHLLVIFLARAHADALEDIVAALNARGQRFVGGVFPGLIDGPERRDEGFIVHAFRCLAAPVVVRLNDGVDWLSEPPAAEGADTPPTLMCLVDFLSSNTTQLLEDLFERYGNDVNYFGAGCGHATREPRPVVFSQDGVFGNAAVVVLLEHHGNVTVRHGWNRKDGPFVATRAEGNVVFELDWEPAVDVYRRALGESLPAEVDTPEALGAAKRFPFGISKEGAEDVVRDPLFFTEDGKGLTCLSAIPENCVLHILTAAPEDLMDAVAQAAGDLRESNTGDARHCLVFDCFSRVTLLADDFNAELAKVTDQVAPLAGGVAPQGALALGEIASDGERLPEFHNKTMAVALLHG